MANDSSKTSAARLVWFAIVGWWDSLGWWRPVAAVGFGGASIWLTVLAAEDVPRGNWSAAIGAVVCFIAAGGITLLVDEARRRAERLRTVEGANLQLALKDEFQPILRSLALMQTKPSDQRDRPLEKAIEKVVNSRTTLFPTNSQVRMTVYRISSVQGRKRRLVVEGTAGRPSDQPQPFVTSDNGRGDAAFEWLNLAGLIPKFIPDTAAQDDAAWKGSGRGYRTYISAPIANENGPLGMLTVDAPTPGDLDETDLPMIEVLAALLAVAYSTARKIR